MPEVVAVALASLVTALACGLGALPLVVVRNAQRRVLGAANAVAAGVMLAASVALIIEGARRSDWQTAVGVAVGLVFIALVRRFMASDDHGAIGVLRGDDAKKGLLIVVVMTVHSSAEGVGVGAAFGGGGTLGVLIAFAIALHNIPEGLAISLVLVPRGMSVRSAAGWSVFSSLPQPLLAVPAFLFVDAFEAVLPGAFGFAAGAMIWMAARELGPEAVAQAGVRIVAAAGIPAFAAMLALQLLLL